MLETGHRCLHGAEIHLGQGRDAVAHRLDAAVEVSQSPIQGAHPALDRAEIDWGRCRLSRRSGPGIVLERGEAAAQIVDLGREGLGIGGGSGRRGLLIRGRRRFRRSALGRGRRYIGSHGVEPCREVGLALLQRSEVLSEVAGLLVDRGDIRLGLGRIRPRFERLNPPFQRSQGGREFAGMVSPRLGEEKAGDRGQQGHNQDGEQNRRGRPTRPGTRGGRRHRRAGIDQIGCGRVGLVSTGALASLGGHGIDLQGRLKDRLGRGAAGLALESGPGWRFDAWGGLTRRSAEQHGLGVSRIPGGLVGNVLTMGWRAGRFGNRIYRPSLAFQPRGRNFGRSGIDDGRLASLAPALLAAKCVVRTAVPVFRHA